MTKTSAKKQQGPSASRSDSQSRTPARTSVTPARASVTPARTSVTPARTPVGLASPTARSKSLSLPPPHSLIDNRESSSRESTLTPDDINNRNSVPPETGLPSSDEEAADKLALQIRKPRKRKHSKQYEKLPLSSVPSSEEEDTVKQCQGTKTRVVHHINAITMRAFGQNARAQIVHLDKYMVIYIYMCD